MKKLLAIVALFTCVAFTANAETSKKKKKKADSSCSKEEGKSCCSKK